jgi:hypothetical protein
MFKRRNIAKTPREHFTRSADEEFAKFERKERSFARPNAPNVQRSYDCLSRPIRHKITSGIRSSIAQHEP